jgi:hypothetical protein
MLAVPIVDAEKVTEQLPETRVHGLPTNDPVTPTWLRVTVPAGVEVVPGELSATVAVHVVLWPVVTLEGEQFTAVVVARRFTVTLAAALVLVLWVVSPPYAPVINAVPVAVGVNATEQLPDDRVQVVELNEPAGPVSANVTAPVGTVGPADVSVTVAVQVEAWFTITEDGVQLTLVDDVC